MNVGGNVGLCFKGRQGVCGGPLASSIREAQAERRRWPKPRSASDTSWERGASSCRWRGRPSRTPPWARTPTSCRLAASQSYGHHNCERQRNRKTIGTELQISTRVKAETIKYKVSDQRQLVKESTVQSPEKTRAKQEKSIKTQKQRAETKLEKKSSLLTETSWW